MGTVRVQVRQTCDEMSRQVLIEQKLHAGVARRRSRFIFRSSYLLFSERGPDLSANAIRVFRRPHSSVVPDAGKFDKKVLSP